MKRGSRALAASSIDARQPRRLDQSVLQGLKGPLHAPLGLWREGEDGLDVERPQRALELGWRGVFRVVLAKDAVPIAVDGHGTAESRDVAAQPVQVSARSLHGLEARVLQAAAGVIDEEDQRAARPPLLEPGVRLPVDLQPLPHAGAPLAQLECTFPARALGYHRSSPIIHWRSVSTERVKPW